MNQTGRILEEVKKAVCGKDHVLVWVLTVLLARGHVLLEDIPGVGKTTMALAFSRALGLEYGRVQFTPDVLPSDITGYSVYQKETGKLVYQPGAVLCNLFLADELNRATSRTQSALLEAMEEGQVTVDGVSHPIPQPFIVFATQNPTGAAGTQLLPDSQMDRFTVRLSIGYPAPEDERNMVLARQGVNPLQTVCQVLSRDELIAMQDEAAAVYIKTELIDYIVALIDATRKHPMILRGASPRATLSDRDGQGSRLCPAAGLCGAEGYSGHVPAGHRAPPAAGSGGRSASDHAGAAARRDPASGPVAKTVRLWRKTAFSTGCFYSQP